MGLKHAVNTPLEVSITPDTNAYGSGDVVGGKLTFTGYAKTGQIVKVTLSDNDNEGAVYDLWLFDSDPTTIADNAAFAPLMTDLANLLAKIPIVSNDYTTVNSLKVAEVYLAEIAAPVPFTGITLYGYLVTNTSTPTFAAAKTIHIRLHVLGES